MNLFFNTSSHITINFSIYDMCRVTHPIHLSRLFNPPFSFFLPAGRSTRRSARRPTVSSTATPTGRRWWWRQEVSTTRRRAKPTPLTWRVLLVIRLHVKSTVMWLTFFFSCSGVRSSRQTDRGVPQCGVSHPGWGHHGIQLHCVCVSVITIVCVCICACVLAILSLLLILY